MQKNQVYQHDNNPKHTAKFVSTQLKDKKISVLDQFAQSFDLNTIENVWAKAERKLRGQKFAKLDQLFEAVNNH